MRGGRGSGKALAVDTLIPTPDGWSKLGEIEVGDTVFDEHGEPCTVTGVFDRVPERAYRLTFSDGTSLDACDEHQWVTWNAAERKALGRRKVNGREIRTNASFPEDWADRPPRTTQEIVKTLAYGPRGDRNHCIPTAEPLHLPRVRLPIHPYLLGYWLGDGTQGEGSLTIGKEDQQDALAQLEAVGAQLVRRPSTMGDRAGAYRVEGLFAQLKHLGLLRNKHVPERYLRASLLQRLALLQGLMDTDGCALERGTVEFTSTTRVLADAVVELARSLGQKPVLAVGRATLDGRVISPKYRVTWRPTIPVFRLARKAARSRFGGAQANRSHHRMIVSAEPILPTPMRCLTVDSPHHMYLAGEGMIPTHNSYAGSHIFAEWITGDDAAGEWAIIAPTYRRLKSDCVESTESGLLAALGGEHDGGWVRQYNRAEMVVYLVNGAVIYLATSEDGAYSIQGKNLRGAWAEEIGLWTNWETAWDESLRLALRKGRSQIVATGTPKFGMPAAKLVRRLLDDPTVPVRTLKTEDNRANLSARMYEDVMKMAGTRLGRQELEGELIDDNPDALWSLGLIDAHRCEQVPDPDTPGRQQWVYPELMRIVIGVDPAVTAKKPSLMLEEIFNDDGSRAPSDETGIIVVGLGTDGHGYVLADLSGRYKPDEMARVVVTAYRYWEADRVVVEVNNGGDYIPHVIATADATVPVRSVRASRGKFTRAEPVAACYATGLMHHAGVFPELEEEMCQWVPMQVGGSPDRLDALVWACTELHLVVESMGWEEVWSDAPIEDGFSRRGNPWLEVYGAEARGAVAEVTPPRVVRSDDDTEGWGQIGGRAQ